MLQSQQGDHPKVVGARDITIYRETTTREVVVGSQQSALEQGVLQRLQELEASSGRQAESLLSLSSSVDRLAQLALSAENRTLKDERTNSASTFGSQPQKLKELDQVQPLLSRLEAYLDELTVLRSDTARAVELSERVRLLEQRFDELQRQTQRPNPGDVAKVAREPPMGESAAQISSAVIANRRRSSKITLVEEMSPKLQYEWCESIWDLSTFINSELMGPQASLLICLCLLLNLILLFLFIAELFPLCIPSFDGETEDAFHLWRTTVAHNVEFRNSLTGESLANGVCNQKLYFPVANFQQQTVGSLKDYIEPTYFGISRGIIMCHLSLWVWLLTMTAEFRCILRFITGLTSIPFEGTTRFEQDESEDSMVMASISHVRWWMVMSLLAVRTCTAGVLAVQGALYLIVEISVEDMVLNSVALEIVLNLDEIIFTAMVPPITQGILCRVMPMRYGKNLTRPRKHWNKWGQFLALSIIYAVVLSLFHYFSLKPWRDALKDNLDAMCGGDSSSYDFVVALDSIGIPWAAHTPRDAKMRADYARYAITEVIKNATGFWHPTMEPTYRSNHGLFMQLYSGDKLILAQNSLPEFRNPRDWTMVNSQNYDDIIGWKEEFLVFGSANFADEQDTVYNHYLRHMLGKLHDPNITCRDVPDAWCYRQGGTSESVVFRQLCPQRCGCASPTAGTVGTFFAQSTSYGFEGCAKFNSMKKSFTELLNDLPCTDTTSPDVFDTWARGTIGAVAFSGHSLLDRMLDDYATGGCDATAMASYLGTDEETRICHQTSLPSVCPQACGCNSSIPWLPHHMGEADFCPRTCRDASPTPQCFTVERSHRRALGGRGPWPGLPCNFPFTFQGVMYNGCTDVGWDNPWCPVTVKWGSSHYWGDCSDACPLHSDGRRGSR